jgi:hypothetical protein
MTNQKSPSNNPRTRPPSRTRRRPRCNYQFADGRRCRMLRHKTTAELCLFHHRALVQLESAEALGAELLALGGEFNHPIPINFVLGKLFAHVATGRMHRRQASTLAYIAQLLLQTLDEKRYPQIRDQYDYRALIPALDLKYGPPKSNRPGRPSSSSSVAAGLKSRPAVNSRAASLGTPTCPGRVSRSAPSATATPNIAVRPQTAASPIPPNADVPDAVRAQYPPPANPEFPEALPDTPWFRQLVLDRRRAAAQAAANSNNHANHHQPTPPARL